MLIDRIRQIQAFLLRLYMVCGHCLPYWDDLAIVEILIKAGACVHFTHESGETSLEIAIKSGHKNVAEYLVAFL